MKIPPAIRVLFTVAAAASVMIAAVAAAAELPAREFPHPDRIRYDSHCLTIDGKDVFIYSGAFHYFRCPKELWRDRFRTIKEAGFNTVETYVAWNWHERQMPSGLNDFSKINLTDLDVWLTTAEEFGLYVIIRPGPYICAEWDTGGYPQWLLTKKPKEPLRDRAWLRTDDPVYLDWCRHWYQAVCPVIARHQLTRQAPGRTGIILFQLENEYDYAALPADIMLNQVKALATVARAQGIDIPLFTCWTHPVRGDADPLIRQVFDSCNFYPRWDVNGIAGDIKKLRREQPDAPLMTTELQGGWFSQVGGALSENQEGVTASQINNLTLFAIQNGDTLLNYYMLFGGTNPGDWGARDLTTSYDYNAPIREWGGVGERYQRVRALAAMLRDHGARLARSETVDCEVNVPQSDVTVAERRAPDGARYFFVRTSQHEQPRDGTARLTEKDASQHWAASFQYHLEPFGAAVLYLPPGVEDTGAGEWLPKPAPAMERPNDLPGAVTITTARTRTDPGPARWKPVVPQQDLADAGIYDSGFVFYRTEISNAISTNLMAGYTAGDDVVASVNGAVVTRAAGSSSRSTFLLPPGRSEVRLLYENRGHPNGGAGMEAPTGILELQMTAGRAGAGRPISGWRMREVESIKDRPEVSPEFKDDDWAAVAVENVEANNLPAGSNAVFRAGIDLTEADLKEGKKVLNLGRVDDLGWVYVNGKSVGHTTDWSRSYSFDVTSQLHPGRNVIAVIVQNLDGAGGLGAPLMAEESDSTPVAGASFGRPAGVEQKWWRSGLNDKRWTSISLGDAASSAGQPNAALTWYRMNFEVPAVKPDVWVPWRLRLKANGNGFLYLNGHELGRYWQAGPQHDFFLPECWMKFGGKGANVLTVSLRPGDKGAAILSATVEPYAEFAEKR
ncbi:MAG: beta-galactosidase [Limisphaerales bacterium]